MRAQAHAPASPSSSPTRSTSSAPRSRRATASSAAMHVVAETFPDPVAQEFRYVVEEMRLGLPLRDALYNLRERVRDPNCRSWSSASWSAQEVGGNLAEVLDNIAPHHPRALQAAARRARDDRAGPPLGPVLTVLPFLVGVVMYPVQPDVLRADVESTTGHYMIALRASSSLIVGHFVIRRIVRIRGLRYAMDLISSPPSPSSIIVGDRALRVLRRSTAESPLSTQRLRADGCRSRGRARQTDGGCGQRLPVMRRSWPRVGQYGFGGRRRLARRDALASPASAAATPPRSSSAPGPS